LKKYISILITLFMLMAAFPVCAESDEVILPSRYATDAFCYSFESEDDFLNSDVSAARSADNTADNPVYSPGAGNSKHALKIRQDCTVNPSGVLNSGVDNITLYPGKTYRISAWVKMLSHENYKVAPNFNFILLNRGTPLYSDVACTEEVSGSGIFDTVIAKGTDIGFKNSDDTISGDWKRLEVTYHADSSFGKYFLDPEKPLQCRLWVRVGSNAHGVGLISDYTDAFLDSIRVPVTDPDTGNVTYEVDTSKFYAEYAIDDWSMEPYEEPAGETAENIISNDFESTSWHSAAGVKWSTSYSETERMNDRPDASYDSANHVMQLTYKGSPYTYMDFSVTTDDTATIMHNRAYKISFRLKASEALSSYFSGKTGYMKLIPERAYGDRLERTKNKWAETRLSDTVSEEWATYEYLWYEPTPHMIGRNSGNNDTVRFDLRIYGMPKQGTEATETIGSTDVTYVYTYQNKNGETVYANYNDFQIHLDDFTIEPMDIVLNGDFAYASSENVPSSVWDTTHYKAGTNPHVPNLFGSGTIQTDSTIPAGKNTLVLTANDKAPGQKVEIDSGNYYKISFWAKADNEASCGAAIAPVLDRSVTGAMRDNAVTDINTEGRWGYGNPTGETGDIPYYLYRGTVQTHTYDTLAVKDGETLVYDDYFARMKSVDGYESQTESTAWNYQYYNGTEWVNENILSVRSDWKLTADWKKYECYYRWDYPGQHYRLPRLSIVTDSAADYRLADIRAEKHNLPENKICVSDVSVLENPHFYIGNDLRLSYDFHTTVPSLSEGSSVLKFLVGDESGVSAIHSMTLCHGGEEQILEVPDITPGGRLGIEIVPVADNGESGVVYRKTFDGIIAGRVMSQLQTDGETVKISVESEFADIMHDKDVMALLSLYDTNNRLIGMQVYPINPAEKSLLEESLPVSGAAKAKLMVVEDLNTLLPCSDNKTELFFTENKLPFENTDTITVAYMGGSSMAGKGIFYPEESTYRAYITECLKDAFPEKEVRALNYAKDGATTAYGVAIAENVAKNNPDIVFIDYALDDNRSDTRAELVSIVEALKSGEKVPYIVFLYTTDHDYTDFSKFHKDVAEKYSIPQIDLRSSLYMHLSGADAKKEGYLFDKIHPSGEGHIIYGKTIIDALQTGKYYHTPK